MTRNLVPIDFVRQIPKALLKGLVYGYRYSLALVLPQACRFEPSCSMYALDALSQHGALVGTWLTIKRLARCHPWGGSGYDPVPECAHNQDPALHGKHQH